MYKIFTNLLDTWFSDFPKKYETRKNRDLFYISKRIVEDPSKYELLSMGKEGVNLRKLESGGKLPSNFDGYQIVEPDDIIFCLYDMDETPRTVGISKFNGMITPSYTIVKCYDDVLPDYIFLIYLLIDSQKGLRPFYTGLRNTIRPNTFMDIQIKIPSYEDQIKICKKMSDFSDILNLENERVKTLKEMEIPFLYKTLLDN
jgi:type I restriction enzyme, S subunit